MKYEDTIKILDIPNMSEKDLAETIFHLAVAYHNYDRGVQPFPLIPDQYEYIKFDNMLKELARVASETKDKTGGF